MRLFDDCERTYEGRSDQGESFHSFLNRSAQPIAAQVRDRCNEWFENYSRNATKDDLRDFRARFSSNRREQYQAASFELMTHQMLVGMGLSVSMHPDIPGTKNRPDFAATSNGSRILVEATVVCPDNDLSKLSHFERDAEHKLLRLELGNFFASIENIEGTLDRFLTRNEIDRAFRTFFDKHDPDKVQRLFDTYGYGALPTERIRFGNWQLTVRLWPARPGLNTQGRVIPWSLDETIEPSVRHVRTKIRNKERNYGPTTDPLILTVNVHALEFSPIDHGKQILFDKDGIWNPRHLYRSNVTGVVFFAYADLVSAPNTRACLFVNPSVPPDMLPPALLHLSRVQGPTGSVCIDGKSVAKILGLA